MLPSYFLSLKLDFCHVFVSFNIFIPSLTYSVCVCVRESEYDLFVRIKNV